jgi:hypothetical protein
VQFNGNFATEENTNFTPITVTLSTPLSRTVTVDYVTRVLL